jgi:hypothetical protein
MGFLDTYFRRGRSAVTVADTTAATVLTAAERAVRTVDLSGTLTAARGIVIAGDDGEDWCIRNGCAYAVTVKASTSDTGVSVAAGAVAYVIKVGTAIMQQSVAGSLYGAYAAMPAAGIAGRIYVASDSPTAQWVDTGSAWVPLIGGMTPGTKPTPAGSPWVAMNVGSCTMADDNGSLLVGGTNDGSGAIKIRGWEQTLSSATAYVEIGLDFLSDATVVGSVWSLGGIFMRESATGKIYSLLHGFTHSSGASFFDRGIWTAYDNRITSTTNGWGIQGNGPLFLRIERVSTNICVKFSRDRITWATGSTDVTTAVFTTAPDRIGIGLAGITMAPRAIVRHFAFGSA